MVHSGVVHISIYYVCQHSDQPGDIVLAFTRGWPIVGMGWNHIVYCYMNTLLVWGWCHDLTHLDPAFIYIYIRRCIDHVHIVVPGHLEKRCWVSFHVRVDTWTTTRICTICLLLTLLSKCPVAATWDLDRQLKWVHTTTPSGTCFEFSSAMATGGRILLFHGVNVCMWKPPTTPWNLGNKHYYLVN